MSRAKSHPPNRDHPWLNRGAGRGKPPYGPGHLAHAPRTISDELREMELSKLVTKDGFSRQRQDDEDVRRARDQSYSGLSEGAGMRRPVRYD